MNPRSLNRSFRVAVLFAVLAGCGGSIDVATSTGTGSSSGGGASTSSTQGPGGASVGSGGAGGTTSGGGSGGGSTTGSGGSGGGMICADFGDPCTSCVSIACPAIYCACTDNPECFALSACFQSCDGDPDCSQMCQTAHQDGISDLYLLSGCAGASCPSECPNNDPISDCLKCVLETCSAEMNACLADPDCVALYNCLDACPTADLVCQQACYDDHGAGAGTLTALLQCQATPCSSVCK